MNYKTAKVEQETMNGMLFNMYEFPQEVIPLPDLRPNQMCFQYTIKGLMQNEDIKDPFEVELYHTIKFKFDCTSPLQPEEHVDVHVIKNQAQIDPKMVYLRFNPFVRVSDAAFIQ